MSAYREHHWDFDPLMSAFVCTPLDGPGPRVPSHVACAGCGTWVGMADLARAGVRTLTSRYDPVAFAMADLLAMRRAA
jgi:hypothetical protein